MDGLLLRNSGAGTKNDPIAIDDGDEPPRPAPQRNKRGNQPDATPEPKSSRPRDVEKLSPLIVPGQGVQELAYSSMVNRNAKRDEVLRCVMTMDALTGHTYVAMQPCSMSSEAREFGPMPAIRAFDENWEMLPSAPSYASGFWAGSLAMSIPLRDVTRRINVHAEHIYALASASWNRRLYALCGDVVVDEAPPGARPPYQPSAWRTRKRIPLCIVECATDSDHLRVIEVTIREMGDYGSYRKSLASDPSTLKIAALASGRVVVMASLVRDLGGKAKARQPLYTVLLVYEFGALFVSDSGATVKTLNNVPYIYTLGVEDKSRIFAERYHPRFGEFGVFENTGRRANGIGLYGANAGPGWIYSSTPLDSVSSMTANGDRIDICATDFKEKRCYLFSFQSERPGVLRVQPVDAAAQLLYRKKNVHAKVMRLEGLRSAVVLHFELAPYNSVRFELTYLKSVERSVDEPGNSSTKSSSGFAPKMPTGDSWPELGVDAFLDPGLTRLTFSLRNNAGAGDWGAYLECISDESAKAIYRAFKDERDAAEPGLLSVRRISARLYNILLGNDTVASIFSMSVQQPCCVLGESIYACVTRTKEYETAHKTGILGLMCVRVSPQARSIEWYSARESPPSVLAPTDSLFIVWKRTLFKGDTERPQSGRAIGLAFNGEPERAKDAKVLGLLLATSRILAYRHGLTSVCTEIGTRPLSDFVEHGFRSDAGGDYDRLVVALREAKSRGGYFLPGEAALHEQTSNWVASVTGKSGAPVPEAADAPRSASRRFAYTYSSVTDTRSDLSNSMVTTRKSAPPNWVAATTSAELQESLVQAFDPDKRKRAVFPAEFYVPILPRQTAPRLGRPLVSDVIQAGEELLLSTEAY